MSTYYGYNSTFGTRRPPTGPGSANSPYFYGSGGARPKPPSPPTTGTGPYGYGGVYPTAPYAGTVTAPAPTNQPGTVTPGGAMDPNAPTRPDLSHLDYSNDPILGRIRALAEESISQANADATAARTRLVIGLGDPDLAKKLGLKDKVAEQARGNTFGTFQELARQLQRRNTFDITGQMSDRANLFYSTTRQRALGLSGEQYLRDKTTATNAAQERLAAISAQVTQARMAAQAQMIAAEQDAYNRALQQALYGMGG